MGHVPIVAVAATSVAGDILTLCIAELLDVQPLVLGLGKEAVTEHFVVLVDVDILYLLLWIWQREPVADR